MPCQQNRSRRAAGCQRNGGTAADLIVPNPVEQPRLSAGGLRTAEQLCGGEPAHCCGSAAGIAGALRQRFLRSSEDFPQGVAGGGDLAKRLSSSLEVAGVEARATKPALKLLGQLLGGFLQFGGNARP